MRSRNSLTVASLALFGLLTALSIVLWAATNFYSLEVIGPRFGVTAERGCLVLTHTEAVQLPWSPDGAIEAVNEHRDDGIRASACKLRHSFLGFQRAWDPSDDVGHGFVLPYAMNLPRQADFDLRIGWNRRFFVLPLWLPALFFLIATLRSFRHRWRWWRLARACRAFLNPLPIPGTSSPSRAERNTRLGLMNGLVAISLLGVFVASGVAISGRIKDRALVGETPMAGSQATVSSPATTAGWWWPEIEGSPLFLIEVHESLKLLKEKDPIGFELVRRFIGRIFEGIPSCVRVEENPATVSLGPHTVFESRTWRASCLVHEAWHCKIYRDLMQTVGNYDISRAHSVTARELDCMKIQVRSLRALGAPAHEIDYVASQDGTHWDANHDGVFDWRDYSAQNW